MNEIKSMISLIDGGERNINRWEKLKNRELVIIPTDSGYYQEFIEWKRNQTNDGKYYDSDPNPLYVSRPLQNSMIDVAIKFHENKINPLKEKLSKETNNETI